MTIQEPVSGLIFGSPQDFVKISSLYGIKTSFPYYVSKKVPKEEIEMQQIKTEDQVSDLFTKELKHESF